MSDKLVTNEGEKMNKIILLVSHGMVGFLGFALGIYLLPIITAPPSPELSSMMDQLGEVKYTGEFVRELEDSDFLHWGEGKLTIGKSLITFDGELAPGPDYKLYLSPEFVETEMDFNRLKPKMVQIGDIKTFDRFALTIPASVEVNDYQAAIVWCETFGQFITSTRFK